MTKSEFELCEAIRFTVTLPDGSEETFTWREYLEYMNDLTLTIDHKEDRIVAISWLQENNENRLFALLSLKEWRKK